MNNHLCLLRNYRTYGIELRERNYPKFEGKYNAYVSCYGQLSGQYLGAIDTPIATDILETDAANLLDKIEGFINEHGHKYPVIW